MLVAASLALFLAMLAGAGFLARAGRFRIPAMSAPTLAALAFGIAWISWRARRGSAWAMRVEAGLLLLWGSYLLVAPSLFEGWAKPFTRACGLALSCWGCWLLARLLRNELRGTKKG